MNIKNIFLFFILIKEILNYIVIPFKIHHSTIKKDNDSDYNSTDFILNYYKNKIYFPIEIGSPKKEVPFILITSSSGLNIGYSLCSRFGFSDLPNNYYEYSVENSTTYNLTSKNIKSISNTITGFQSTELFKLYTDLQKSETNHITIKDLPFIYTSKEDVYKYNDDGTICGLMGLALYEENTFRETYNIINVIKKKNITNNYYFSYEYDENNNDEGFLIIGEEPHIYNRNKYNEEQLKVDYAVGEHFDIVWGIMFNSIYFFDDDNNKTTINDIKYARFVPEFNLIKGTLKYKAILEEKFFNYYINKSICRFEREPQTSYSVMSCDANSEFKVEKFPTLFFTQTKFNFTFELDYNDLFIKKGNKYFFNIIFPQSYIEHFEMGKIFLKKYFFTYNTNKKTIGFYNKNIQIDNNYEKYEKEEKTYLKYLIIIGIIVIIVFCLIGFCLGKKICEKTRNIRKNELDEEYNYSLNK
jgi:hypothetical protein